MQTVKIHYKYQTWMESSTINSVSVCKGKKKKDLNLIKRSKCLLFDDSGKDLENCSCSEQMRNFTVTEQVDEKSRESGGQKNNMMRRVLNWVKQMARGHRLSHCTSWKTNSKRMPISKLKKQSHRGKNGSFFFPPTFFFLSSLWAVPTCPVTDHLGICGGEFFT